MPRKRNTENAGLPPRWKLQHGAYYYRVPPGLEHLWNNKQMFRLGTSLPEAHREWAARLDAGPHDLRTVNDIFDRYLLEVVPTKAPKTQGGDQRHVKRLRPVFGTMLPEDIEPQHVYQYADKRGKKTSARLELAVLSHAMTMAVKWGRIKAHPFKGEVRLEGSKPRTRYIEDWEIIEVLAMPPVRRKDGTTLVRAYLGLKLLTGLRKSDMLRLPVTAAKEDGLHITPGKTENSTGKTIIIEWSDALRKAWAEALAARPVHIAPWVFCTRRGEPYIDEATGSTSGFDSIWQRFMGRCLEKDEHGKSVLKERFTEHDLRAKVGSDSESLERAQKLLTHADAKLTQRVYRRKPEKVQPLR